MRTTRVSGHLGGGFVWLGDRHPLAETPSTPLHAGVHTPPYFMLGYTPPHPIAYWDAYTPTPPPSWTEGMTHAC